MPKRTYQPSKKKRARKFGFLARAKSKVIKNRRQRGRARLTPVA